MATAQLQAKAKRGITFAALIAALTACQGFPAIPFSTPTPAVDDGATTWPTCDTAPNADLCNEAVNRVFTAGGTGMHVPSPGDVLADSACSADGCTATLTLIATDGFTLIAELTSDGPDDRWTIVSMTREPGGPIPVPSGA